MRLIAEELEFSFGSVISEKSRHLWQFVFNSLSEASLLKHSRSSNNAVCSLTFCYFIDEKNWFLLAWGHCLWSLHSLPSFAWIFSRVSGFFPHPQVAHVSDWYAFIVTVWVRMSVEGSATCNGRVFCVSPALHPKLLRETPITRRIALSCV